MGSTRLIEGFCGFFAGRGTAAPVVRPTAEPPPPPLDVLLAHRRTMTEVLAATWGTPLGRRTLDERIGEGRLERTVLLLDGAGLPVQFARLEVELEALPAGAGEALRRSPAPFGGWLRAEGIEPEVRVESYFTVEPTALLCRLLAVEAAPLWGRIAALSGEAGRLIARSMEVPLPPRHP